MNSIVVCGGTNLIAYILWHESYCLYSVARILCWFPVARISLIVARSYCSPTPPRPSLPPPLWLILTPPTHPAIGRLYNRKTDFTTRRPSLQSRSPELLKHTHFTTRECCILILSNRRLFACICVSLRERTLFFEHLWL